MAKTSLLLSVKYQVFGQGDGNMHTAVFVFNTLCSIAVGYPRTPVIKITSHLWHAQTHLRQKANGVVLPCCLTAMEVSKPVAIAEHPMRRKKKRRTRATDGFAGSFTGRLTHCNANTGLRTRTERHCLARSGHKVYTCPKWPRYQLNWQAGRQAHIYKS